MKTVELSASKRVEMGGKNARSIRREGKVPAAVYGGAENHNIEVNEVQFTKLINTPEVFFVDLDIDGNKVKSVIKEVQFHPVSDRVTHVDFVEVADDRAVKFGIPITLTGQSIGVMNGGKLRLVMRKLRVKGLPTALPDNVEIDITKLKIGDAVKVSDIQIPGVEILEAGNAVIVAIKTSRVAVVADEEVEGEEGAEGEGGEGGEAPAEGGGEAPAEGGDGGE